MDRIRLQPSLVRDFRVMIIGIIAISFTVMVWMVGASYTKQVHASLQDIDADALRVERHVMLTLENTGYLLESLGRKISRSELQHDLPTIDSLLAAFLPQSGSTQHVLSWINRDQRLTVSNNGGVLKHPVDVSDRDYVKKAVAEPWRLHIGRPIQGRVSGKWVLPLSLGITNDENIFIGTVIISMDVNALKQQLEETAQTHGLHLAITNRAYTRILETENPPAEFEKTISVTDMLKIDFSHARRHILSQPSITHPNQLLRVIDAPSTLPLRMFYSLHPTAFKKALFSRLLPQLLEVLGIASFLLLALWNLKRRLITPVAALTQYTSNVVRTTAQQIPEIRAPIEVQQLRQEIQHLCHYLHERTLICEELRNKLAVQTDNLKRDQRYYQNYQIMTDILMQDIAVLAQHWDDPASGKALLAILREMRPLLSHGKSEQPLLHEKPYDMSLLLKRTIHAFRETHAPSLDVIVDTRATLVWLECDAHWISHILMLLMRYETEHMTDAPALHITASVRNGAWWLTISRPGLAHEPASAAIGLAVARAVMALHNGSVEHQNAAAGKRSITLRFPAERVSNH
jgi:signal transduction histidine kinase